MDGRVFEIDKITDVRKAASMPAGGVGVRYTCIINDKEKYLFYEGPAWFVEGKVRESKPYENDESDMDWSKAPVIVNFSRTKEYRKAMKQAANNT